MLLAGSLATTRPFHMGFTQWPADLTAEGVAKSVNFANAHGDLISVMFIGGIPWDASLSGGKYSADVDKNLAYRPPAGKKLFLSISPLDQSRAALAPNWGEKDNQPLSSKWMGKALDDPDVVGAFTNFALRSVAAMKPDYLAIGIESNVLLSKNPAKWEQWKRLHQATYRAVKAKNPDLPIFFTVEVNHFLKNAAEAKESDQIGQVKEMLPFEDIFAMSLYPHMANQIPRPFPSNYLDFARQFKKPIAISESGMTSADVKLKSFGLTLHGSEEEQKLFVERVLGIAARDKYSFVVNFATTDFEALCKRLPPPADDIGRIWSLTGLQTADGKAKPALKSWDTALAQSFRRD
ncbi:glycosyl hydrolase 53 family protein [Fimbriimonas ginsengisoli]|uniref:Arabinogalactan endo-beta-1,4-galactanase n=1 Tax=Fimbriimonas ginsengisoli Gsoil 348 TaxID=661478 RepID=A0A068NQT4_FIMGI|nr:glycosyl hydrolase 53 family protein [Fimbriimonas ginsengisoli]AIE85913.1 hypothetical protein OP10G_2545 [Fimbriimonas ginsengisoli Gsoil 348]